MTQCGVAGPSVYHDYLYRQLKLILTKYRYQVSETWPGVNPQKWVVELDVDQKLGPLGGYVRQRCMVLILMSLIGIWDVFPACHLAISWTITRPVPVPPAIPFPPLLLSIDQSVRPDHLKFPGPGRWSPPGPTLTPLLAQSLLGPVGPGWGLLPGLVLLMAGTTHLPTQRGRGGWSNWSYGSPSLYRDNNNKNNILLYSAISL